MSPGRPIIVAGMHRSGTSAVARVLNLLGVDLGPSQDLMDAKPDNPDGFWENKEIVRLHDDMLAHLGGEWDEPPLTLGLLRIEGAEDASARARAIVDRFVGDRPGFKDPRASLLLEFWRGVWPTARVVVSVRHPEAVAASLKQRDGFDEDKCAGLWMRYTWDALSCSADPVVVHFEDLIHDPDTEVKRIAASLDLAPLEVEVANAVASINTDRSRIPRPRRGEPGERMSLALELYELLANVPPPVFAVVAAGIREPQAVIRLVAAESRVSELQGGLVAAESRVSESQEAADGFHEDLKRTQRDFAAARQEADRQRALSASRLVALEREERAREALSVQAAQNEQALRDLRRVLGRLDSSPVGWLLRRRSGFRRLRDRWL